MRRCNVCGAPLFGALAICPFGHGTPPVAVAPEKRPEVSTAATRHVRRIGAYSWPRVFVIVATIPSRADSFRELCSRLAQQTKPFSLAIRFDGYEEAAANRLVDYARGLGIRIAHYEISAEARGAGFRWRLLSSIHSDSDDIVVTLDDDLLPKPIFLEITAGLVLTENAVITWHGWRYEPDNSRPEGAYFQEPDEDLEACAIGAGCSAYRVRWVSKLATAGGLEPWLHRDHRDQFLHSGPQCDDDAYLATVLWKDGVRMLRPAGAAPLDEHPVARGQNAGHNQHGIFRHAQRLALSMVYDVPMIDHHFPPPENMRKEFIAQLGRLPRTPQLIEAIDRQLARARDRYTPQLRQALRDVWQVQRHRYHVYAAGTGPWIELLTFYCAACGVWLTVEDPVPGIYAAYHDRYSAFWSPPPPTMRTIDLVVVAPGRDSWPEALDKVLLK